MRVEIFPGKASGIVCAPPSKSCTHRALLCAALSEDESAVENVSFSDDITAALACVSALGRSYKTVDNRIIFPCGGLMPSGEAFRCGESASTLRFFIPAALIASDKVSFECSSRLMMRGIGVYEDVFKAKNISVDKTENMITVCGKLSAGEYRFPGNVSSQFASGLMMALPMLRGDSALELIPPVESRPYIDLTLEVMRAFGINVTEERDDRFVIRGGRRYKGCRFTVEGDWSNAAPVLLFNHIGGRVAVNGLDDGSTQGDRVCGTLFEELKNSRKIDISDCPDLGPIMMAAAAVFGGGRITGTHRLRIKESDRANAMASELFKFGIRCDIGENSVAVLTGELKKPSELLDGHNDHRIVMALSVLASITGGVIDRAEAINKSWPTFFDALETIGIKIKID